MKTVFLLLLLQSFSMAAYSEEERKCKKDEAKKTFIDSCKAYLDYKYFTNNPAHVDLTSFYEDDKKDCDCIANNYPVETKINANCSYDIAPLLSHIALSTDKASLKVLHNCLTKK